MFSHIGKNASTQKKKIYCASISGHDTAGNVNKAGLDTASGKTYSIPPHMRAYAKIARVRAGENKLLIEIHQGYIRYYLARGQRPPTVSTSIIEDPDGFLEYAQRHTI